MTNSPLIIVLIACGSIAAAVILFYCFKAKSRPDPRYRGGAEPPGRAEQPSASLDYGDGGEQKPRRTPGFVLPLPSDAGRTLAPTEPPRQSAPSSRPAYPENAARANSPDTDISGPDACTNEPPAQRQRAVETAAPTAKDQVLVFRNGAREGQRIRLDSFSSGQCAIGRSDVPENQVVIRDDPKLSRVRHAIISCDAAGQYTIRDNNSANRVYVNEQCIESAPVSLAHGDRIRVGMTELEYLTEPVSRETCP